MTTYSFAVPLQAYNILELFNTQTLLPEKTTVLGWVQLDDLELQVNGSLQLGSQQSDAFNGAAVYSRQIDININFNLLGATFAYASSGKYYFDSNSLLIAGVVGDQLTVYDFLMVPSSMSLSRIAPLLLQATKSTPYRTSVWRRLLVSVLLI